MPPGASDTRENMFALLADTPPGKRKKTTTRQTYTPFPDLPLVQKENPKYLVMSMAETGKKIADLSCFAVYKAIQTISKEIISITELRDGNLLLLVKNQKIAESFLKTTHLPYIGHVKCNYHETLNLTKGTIYAPYLNKIPEEEIISELKDQGVKAVYKFLKNVEGKQTPCGVLLLSFDLYNLPSTIDISWHSVRVKEYIPNPMRCKTCQLLGHTKKWCKNNPTCVQCNLPPHAPEECTRTMCANCYEPHPSSSAECKMFQQQKEILKIKTQKKCSLNKARQIYKDQNVPPTLATSYALALTNAQMPTSSSSNTQNKNNNNNTNNKNSFNSGAQSTTNNNSNSKKDDNNTCLNSANGSDTTHVLKTNYINAYNNKESHKITELNTVSTKTNLTINELNKPTNKILSTNSDNTNNTAHTNSTAITDIVTTLKNNSSSIPTTTPIYNTCNSNNSNNYSETSKTKPPVSFDIEMSDVSHSESTNNKKSHSYKLRSSQLNSNTQT